MLCVLSKNTVPLWAAMFQELLDFGPWTFQNSATPAREAAEETRRTATPRRCPSGVGGGGESASGPAPRAARDRRWWRRGGRGGISHQPVAAAGALRSASAAFLAGCAPRPRPPGKRVPGPPAALPRASSGQPSRVAGSWRPQVLRPPRPSRKLSECGAPPSWSSGRPSCALPPPLLETSGKFPACSGSSQKLPRTLGSPTVPPGCGSPRPLPREAHRAQAWVPPRRLAHCRPAPALSPLPGPACTLT